MSLRGYRIFGRSLPSGAYSVVVESVHNESYLHLQSGAIITLNKEAGRNLTKTYTKVADAYGIMGILRLFELGDAYLIIITGVLSAGKLYECDIYKVTTVQCILLNRDQQAAEAVDPRIIDVNILEGMFQLFVYSHFNLQRLLSAGIFYFACSNDRNSMPFNLTQSAQKRATTTTNLSSPDFRFFWLAKPYNIPYFRNRNLCLPFDRYGIDSSKWCAECMCGSVVVQVIYVGARTAKVAIISRLSCERVGTRFNVRGVNDEGSVANFVETEQLITFEDQESSFVQVRGSVPLFWEQPGINVGSHKVKIKSAEVSIRALERHFTALKCFYGTVSTVNLLGSKEGERTLSNAFKRAMENSSHSELSLICYDYHAQLKQSRDSLRQMINQIEHLIDGCQFFHKRANTILNMQQGVIRTNCLDCLDRTNNVQTPIGLKMLAQQLSALNVEQVKANISTRFEEVLRDLWQRNGDQCSMIYAGTGALEGKSKLKDASRSIARTIQNNLMDSSKQESFDLLLLGCTFGNNIFDKASTLLPSNVIKECTSEVEAFIDREREVCTVEPLLIFVGTWNVNGGKNMYNVAFRRNENPLNSWIFDQQKAYNTDYSPDYDIIVIGLEEIVDLNAGNIMKASTTNQRVWRDGIKKAINEFETAAGANYVVLGCEQLVGVCLIVYVKMRLLNNIRDLSIGMIKTGMGGATGNKGSIAIRFTLNSTSLCFVCSHFAAGQNDIAARNEDFQAAMRKIRFPMGRTIAGHDVVVWLGDFNYRISLGGEEVKQAIRSGRLDTLVRYDQLTQQREIGNIFVNFQEGPLVFAPTYKYDTFSDDYDTSEKCRSPAWTDRVLFRDAKRLLHLYRYCRSELKTSDHRPVGAVFKLDSMRLDLAKAEEVISNIVCSMGPPDATILCSIDGHDQFPDTVSSWVHHKLAEELDSKIALFKLEGAHMHIVLSSGVEALAALSMDQLKLPTGERLNVVLRSPEWADKYCQKLSRLFAESTSSQQNGSTDEQQLRPININLDDEEDDDNGVPELESLNNAFSDF